MENNLEMNQLYDLEKENIQKFITNYQNVENDFFDITEKELTERASKLVLSIMKRDNIDYSSGKKIGPFDEVAGCLIIPIFNDIEKRINLGYIYYSIDEIDAYAKAYKSYLSPISVMTYYIKLFEFKPNKI